MNDEDNAHRVRLLERLMGDEPTEHECRTMWEDRPRLERLLALQEGVDWPGPDYNRLQAYDYELWRAKVRTELGSLTGVLDGLAICRENSLLLPDWLQEIAPRYLAHLGLPEDTEAYKYMRKGFKKERRKLKLQKRAEIVHQLTMQRIMQPECELDMRNSTAKRKRFEESGEEFDKLPNPPEVEAAIRSGIISPKFEITSITQASKITELALRGTWAQASKETIRHDYINARVQLRVELGREELSLREEGFVCWDVAFVRPESLELLGLRITS